MCTRRGRALAWLCALAGLCAPAAARAGACDDLQARWRPWKGGNIPLLVDGKETSVTVLGEGGGARAAAALMLAAVRHVLGHAALLELRPIDLCDLAADHSDWRKFAVVAPTVPIPRASCQSERLAVHLVMTFAPAASPSSIHVFAHLPGRNCAELVNNTSIFTADVLINCGFIESKAISTYNGTCDGCFAVLARNESLHDDQVASELQQQIKSLHLPLQLVFFNSDLLLRKMVLNLQKDNKTFLFLDEDIWTDASTVFRLPPPSSVFQRSSVLDSRTTVRIGDGICMKVFAPPIFELVNRFAPEPKDLRQILEYEFSSENNFNISEAACHWALENDEKIQNWTERNITRNYTTQTNSRTYNIRVFLCDEDPDNTEYENVIKIVNKRLSSAIKDIKYNCKTKKINCSDKNYFKNLIYSVSMHSDEAGVVAWGPSATAEIVKEAENRNLPFLLAGPTLPEVLLDSAVAVHANSATLINMTRAYLELFRRCEWTRIAVLSDDTNYSRTFIQKLLSFDELITHEKIVEPINIKDTLDKYRQEDARIFFVNTNWDIAFIIICTAWKLGMTPDDGFMWIVRDWRPKKKCNDEIHWRNMYHYSIESAWRRGAPAGGSPELRSDLPDQWRVDDAELAAPSGSAALAEALLLLGHGFAKFLTDYPSYMYALHRQEFAMKFSKSLSNLTINGTVEELKSKPDKRLVFIEKWSGLRGSSIATWSVDRNGVHDVWPNNTATCAKLFGRQLPDRRHCLTFTTGDPFAPRCHEWTLAAILFVVPILSFIAIIARRVRLMALRRIENEKNRCVVSGLDQYLVSRDSITMLYKIGEGANGEVHFAQFKTSNEIVSVAAKEPHQCVTFVKMVDFLHEGYIMASLHHENVIRLIGVCIEGGRPTLLMEHAYYNDLQQYLSFRRKFAISAILGEVPAEEAMEVSDGELTRFAREAAAALDYLAGQRLVHRDVRAANCLVDKQRSLKLADFGLARKFKEQEAMYISQRRDMFPVLWMAPEALKYGSFSPASDVWSLGVLILEVATLGARPFGPWLKNQVFEYVLSGGRPPLPPDTSKCTRTLTSECWRSDAESRPNAKYIHDYLTRNPQAISPALLAPDLPDSKLSSYKRKTTCDLISLPF